MPTAVSSSSPPPPPLPPSAPFIDEWTYSDAVEICAAKGYTLCAQSWKNERCAYNQHPVYTNLPCEKAVGARRLVLSCRPRHAVWPALALSYYVTVVWRI